VRRRCVTIFATTVVLALAIAPLVAAAPLTVRRGSPPPKAWGGSYQVAEAIWVVRERGGLFMYMAFAENISGPRPKARTAVFLGRGRCYVRKNQPKRTASCAVNGRFRKIDASGFSIDPSLSEAGVAVPGVRIRWSKPGNPRPAHNIYADAPFLDFEAEVKRPATAGGRLLGRRVTRADLFTGRLGQGVFGGGKPTSLPTRPLRSSPSTLRIRIRF
jgi:hypothetical protein